MSDKEFSQKIIKIIEDFHIRYGSRRTEDFETGKAVIHNILSSEGCYSEADYKESIRILLRWLGL